MTFVRYVSSKQAFCGVLYVASWGIPKNQARVGIKVVVISIPLVRTIFDCMVWGNPCIRW